MQRLLAFLYRYRVFGFFLFLEVICFWLFTSYNSYYNAYFFNSSNRLAGQLQMYSTNTADYFRLQEINQSLARENAILRESLLNNQYLHSLESDTLTLRLYTTIPAKVVNNDFRKSRNYLTLDKGTTNGIRPNMGVIGPDGIVGVVKSVSGRFSTVTSLLHQGVMISSELKSNGTLCTTQWDTEDPTEASLRYIPRHIELGVGDTIVSSGYNSIFPEGVLIGTVSWVELEKESPFYDARVSLSTSFPSLEYVYVINYELRAEKDSLEQISYE